MLRLDFRMPRPSDDLFSDSDEDLVSPRQEDQEDHTKSKKDSVAKSVAKSRSDVRREYIEYKRREKKQRENVRTTGTTARTTGSTRTTGTTGTTRTTRTTRTPRGKAAYLAVNKYFEKAFKDTSASGDSEAFKYLLKKTPVPVVLHHMHFLFDTNRDNANNVRLLVAYNDRYNIVSRYFLKAMKSKDRAALAVQSLAEVSKKLFKKTALKDIDNLHHFTPEFILMTTIQAGDMDSYDKIVSEWEIMDAFKRSCDLIAAFFGVKNFFADTSRFVDRQALFISCICGGSVDTLSKIVKSTDTKWLSDFTMRKTREMSTPPQGMLEHLAENYGLKM